MRCGNVDDDVTTVMELTSLAVIVQDAVGVLVEERLEFDDCPRPVLILLILYDDSVGESERIFTVYIKLRRHFVCLSVPPLILTNSRTDHDQIWHAHVNRSGNGSNLNNLPHVWPERVDSLGPLSEAGN